MSKATKLKEVAFRVTVHNVAWITTALETITSEHKALQQISIHFIYYYEDLNNVSNAVGGSVYHEEWIDLDGALVQFCESRGCRVKAVPDLSKGGEYKYIEGFLPKMTEQGLIDVVCS